MAIPGAVILAVVLFVIMFSYALGQSYADAGYFNGGKTFPITVGLSVATGVGAVGYALFASYKAAGWLQNKGGASKVSASLTPVGGAKAA